MHDNEHLLYSCFFIGILVHINFLGLSISQILVTNNTKKNKNKRSKKYLYELLMTIKCILFDFVPFLSETVVCFITERSSTLAEYHQPFHL